MSTPKNRMSLINIDAREERKDVKQRFATGKPNPISENIKFAEKSGNIGNIDILEIFKKSENDNTANISDISSVNNINNLDADHINHIVNINDINDTSDIGVTDDKTPVSFVNLNYAEDSERISINSSIENKVETLQSQVERIESQFEEFANKIKRMHNLQPENADNRSNNNYSNSENIGIEDNAVESDNAGSGNFQDYFFKNITETVIIEEVATTLKHTSHICKCGKCFHDICAIALNNTPPHYVTTEQGELLQKASALLNIENLSKISAEIFKAIDIVKNRPSH